MRDIRTETGILSDVIGGISGAARTMTYAFTAPMVALGTYAVQAAATFDASMRNINSIAQLPEAQFKVLSQQVLDFGKNTRAGAEGASKALYEVYSAGIVGADAFNIMQISVKTAEAGLADLTGTVKGLTAAGLTFGDTSAAAMQRYSEATTLAVQLGVGSMDVFNTGISNVIGTGSLLGASFENLAASIAFLSQRGISFASAGTYMNNALSKLIKPGEELSAMFDTLNVKSGKELIDTFGGIEGALRAIYGQIGDDETKWAKLFPDVRGFKAVAPFIKAFKEDGNDAVNSFFGNFDEKMKAGNVTGAAWDQQMMSFNATLDLFKSALQAVAITIGQAIMPIIQPVVQRLTEFMITVSNTNPQLLQMSIGIIGVIAAAAPLVWILTSMLNPIGLLIAGAAALATAFTINFNGIRDTVAKAVASVLGDITPLKDAFTDFWTKVFPPAPTAAQIMGGSGAVKIQSDDYIVIEKPMSLWELYTSKGYDKMFSWTEFMKKAKEGGWDGKALDIGSKIKLPDPTAMDGASKGLDTLATSIGGFGNAMNGVGTGANNTTPTFLTNLTQAINSAWPKVKTALETMWGNITTWVVTTGLPLLDGYGAQIMDTIAGWFNPTQRNGDTQSYEVIRGVVGGGAAKGVQAGIGQLQKTFPQISAGLRQMIDAVGSWLQTEGIPTVSRSIGYFVGTIGVKFGELLGGLANFLKGGDMSGAANGVKGAVVDPAYAGFMDAMKDNKIKAGADQFFSGVAGIFVAAAGVSVFGQMLMGKGLLSAVMSTIGSVLSGTATVAKGLGSAGVAMFNGLMNTATGANVANGVSNFAGSVMSTITDALGTAAGKITGLVDKVASPILTKISSGLETKALQSMMLWDSVMEKIGVGLGKATGAVTSTTGWVVNMASKLLAPITGAIGAMFAAAPALPIILAGITIIGILAVLLPEGEKKKIQDVLAHMFDTEPIKIPDPVVLGIDQLRAVIPTDYDINTADIYSQINYVIDNLMQGGYTKSDETYMIKLKNLVVEYQDGAIDLPTFKASVDKLVQAAINGIQVMDTSGDKAQYEFTPIVAAKPTAPSAAKVAADNLLNPVWQEVANNIALQAAAGGSTDTTALANSMVAPFTEQFTTAFGTAGTVTTKWQEFIDKFNMGINTTTLSLVETGTKIGLFSIGVILANTLAIASFNGYNGVKDKLTAVNDEAKKVQDTLGSLVSHSPYEIVVNITTNGSMPTVPGGGGKPTANGSHANGLDRVPFNNYMANLHQDEAVLNKSDASVWRNLPQILASIKGDKSSDNTAPQYNTIYINGVQDVDSVLKEFDRRGIKIGTSR